MVGRGRRLAWRCAANCQPNVPLCPTSPTCLASNHGYAGGVRSVPSTCAPATAWCRPQHLLNTLHAAGPAPPCLLPAADPPAHPRPLSRRLQRGAGPQHLHGAPPPGAVAPGARHHGCLPPVHDLPSLPDGGRLPPVPEGGWGGRAAAGRRWGIVVLAAPPVVTGESCVGWGAGRAASGWVGGWEERASPAGASPMESGRRTPVLEGGVWPVGGWGMCAGGEAGTTRRLRRAACCTRPLLLVLTRGAALPSRSPFRTAPVPRTWSGAAGAALRR